MEGLRTAPVRVSLAGNRHPEFDAWLGRRVPEVLPRETLPIANLVRSPLHQVDRWLARVPGGAAAVGAPAATAVAADDAEPGGGPTAPVLRGAAVAALRYPQNAVNLRRLLALLRRRRPDVLLINNGGYPGGESCRVLSLAARRAGIPRTVHFVHNMANPPEWPPDLERALDRRIDASVDVWVTAARRASDRLAAQRPIPRQRIETVHYGIPLTAGDVPPAPVRLRAELGFDRDGDGGDLRVLVVANFEPRKGHAVLIDALAQLGDGGVPVRAALVGEGPLRGELTDRVRNLNLDDRVRFLGWRDDVAAIMPTADVLVLPSLGHECLPYVILEAMDHRLPVVSTDVAGIPEMVVDGETGRVVAPGDAAALAGALRQLTDPDRRRTMGAAGRARVAERFGRARMVARMCELLRIPAPSAAGPEEDTVDGALQAGR